MRLVRGPWPSDTNPYVWRIGHHTAPLDYPPREYCAWNHRFDDPQQEYRTLYAAEHAITCMRELLADLRPDAKARADYAQFQARQEDPPEELHRPARTVTMEWRESHALARATVVRDGELWNLADAELREELTDRHATLLNDHGMPYLDITQVTSKNRIVTQTISRDLYERGAAGILFTSNHGGGCVALMEGRAALVPAGDPIALTENHPDLLRVCSEYNLILKQLAAAAPAGRGGWRP
jgi:hypothetical protein